MYGQQNIYIYKKTYYIKQLCINHLPDVISRCTVSKIYIYI